VALGFLQTEAFAHFLTKGSKLRSQEAPPLFKAVGEGFATPGAASFLLFRSPRSLIRNQVAPSFLIDC